MARIRGTSLCTTTNAASVGTATCRVRSDSKSMCRASPSRAPAIARGSSRPTCTPAARSASWHSRARASGSRAPGGSRSPGVEGSERAWPTARRKATEKAALEESPAPTGRVLVTEMVPPAGRWVRVGGGRPPRGPRAAMARSSPGGWLRRIERELEWDLDVPRREVVGVEADQEAARLGAERDLGGHAHGHG